MAENRIPVSSCQWKWVKQYKIASVTKIPDLMTHIQTEIEPWEGRGKPGDPGDIPPIPNLARFVEADDEGGLSLENQLRYAYST